jgi:hypothetical protein
VNVGTCSVVQFCENDDVCCFCRVGVDEEVEMLPYTGVRSVSIVLRTETS